VFLLVVIGNRSRGLWLHVTGERDEFRANAHYTKTRRG
jgi:hypothetical protein